MSSKETNKPKITLLEYQRLRLQDMTTEQRKVYPIAMGLMGAPSDEAEEMCIFDYHILEERIQRTRNEILKLKGI